MSTSCKDIADYLGIVKGVVPRVNDVPIPDVIVVISDVDSSVTTDADGKYTFSNINLD